jgi:hypothetical protein
MPGDHEVQDFSPEFSVCHRLSARPIAALHRDPQNVGVQPVLPSPARNDLQNPFPQRTKRFHELEISSRFVDEDAELGRNGLVVGAKDRLKGDLEDRAADVARDINALSLLGRACPFLKQFCVDGGHPVAETSDRGLRERRLNHAAVGHPRLAIARDQVVSKRQANALYKPPYAAMFSPNQEKKSSDE